MYTPKIYTTCVQCLHCAKYIPNIQWLLPCLGYCRQKDSSSSKVLQNKAQLNTHKEEQHTFVVDERKNSKRKMKGIKSTKFSHNASHIEEQTGLLYKEHHMIN